MIILRPDRQGVLFLVSHGYATTLWRARLASVEEEDTIEAINDSGAKIFYLGSCSSTNIHEMVR